MPTPTNDATRVAPIRVAPIRVAECRHCGQLFAVYAATGEIACPACDATSSVESLQIVELGVAAPVEVKVEAPLAAPIEQRSVDLVEQPSASAPADHTAHQSDEDRRPPTVAQWLLQSEELSASSAAPPEAKRSLAESLGWKPGSFEVPSLAAKREEASSLLAGHGDESADEAAPLVNPLADFRFDFGATPLSEQDGPLSEQDGPLSEQDGPLSEHEELRASDADGVSLELSAPAEDAPQPLRLDALSTAPPRLRGWGNFVGMAIGLMLVAGPAAYLAMTWNSDDSTMQLASLDGRRLSEEAPEESATEHDEPPAHVVAPPKPTVAADPFVDSSAQPASYDKEPASFEKDPASFGKETDSGDREPGSAEKEPAGFDTGGADEPEFSLPPSAPTEVERPATASIDPIDANPPQAAAGSPTAATSAADPFLSSPPPATAVSQPTATPPAPGEGRYGAAAAPAEPAAFAAPEEKMDPMVEPVTAIAEPKAAPMASPTQQTGLVNAPKYGARELAEAFSPAEAAAVGFATGSLDDPAQVSTMGQHYAQLCHLAQVLTLLDTSDPGLMTAELQAAETFKRLLRDDRSRAQSRQIAGPWIAWTGRPHGGVFFAGLPDDVRRAGEVVEYQFRIGESVVPVVMAQAVDPNRFANSAEVGVIGVVVENPRQWIAGYEGDAPRVVWARKTLPLPRAEGLSPADEL